MGIEIMFDDHVVNEKAHKTKKILILHSCHTEILFEVQSHHTKILWLNQDFG